MLYHCTHKDNVESIMRSGLLAAKSTGKAKRVWACEEENILWAIRHVCIRHGWARHDVVILTLNTYGTPFRRSGKDGVYWTPADVPENMITQYAQLMWCLVGEGGGRTGRLRTV